MNSITPFSIYLFGILDELKIFFLMSGVVLSSIFGFAGMITEGEFWTRYYKLFFPITILSFLLAVFIPSSKTYAAMVILPKIAQSDVIKKDVPEMYEAAKNLLLNKKAEQ